MKKIVSVRLIYNYYPPPWLILISNKEKRVTITHTVFPSYWLLKIKFILLILVRYLTKPHHGLLKNIFFSVVRKKPVFALTNISLVPPIMFIYVCFVKSTEKIRIY